MKKFLLGAAAAMAIAAPGIAAADTDLVIGAQYSSADYGGGDDINLYGFNGAVGHELANGTFLQLDGQWDRADASGCCISSGYGAVHWGMRNDTYAFAGFVGLEDLIVYSGVEVGAEGQWYLSNVVFNGSVAYMDLGDIDASFTNVSVDGSYFFTPNFSVGALAGYTDTDGTDITTLGLEGEYRFANSPTSLTIGYRNNDYDGFSADTWSIGVTFDLGADSLIDRAKTGPSLNGASRLYDAIGLFL